MRAAFLVYLCIGWSEWPGSFDKSYSFLILSILFFDPIWTKASELRLNPRSFDFFAENHISDNFFSQPTDLDENFEIESPFLWHFFTKSGFLQLIFQNEPMLMKISRWNPRSFDFSLLFLFFNNFFRKTNRCWTKSHNRKTVLLTFSCYFWFRTTFFEKPTDRAQRIEFVYWFHWKFCFFFDFSVDRDKNEPNISTQHEWGRPRSFRTNLQEVGFWIDYVYWHCCL